MDRRETQAALPAPTTDGRGMRAWLGGLAASPYVWGGLATFGFYRAIPELPVYRELAERYFCAHPVEYIQTALFFVGLCILLRKLLRLRLERGAVSACLRHAPFDRSSDAESHTEHGARAPAGAALRALAQCAARWTLNQRRTAIAGRLAAIAEHLQHRPSAESLPDQLKELDHRSTDQLHDSYALLQTIIWAIPIMGFLGTVLGITMAIANLDVNQLDSSLSAVTLHLAVAFDTTAVALCHSLILVFLYLFAKRSEEGVLAQIAEFCRRELLPLVPVASERPGALIEAESAAARTLVERTGDLIESQTRLWTDSIEELRLRWNGTLEQQQQALAQALQQGTHATLNEHADQLAELRGEFIRALEQLAQHREQADVSRREHERQLTARWEQCLAGLQTALDAAQRAAEDRTVRWLDDLSVRIGGWQAQLAASTERLDAHLQHLARTEELLASLLDQGSSVVNLQEQLTENLQALRAAETFEQTMHGLSAAVHLLSAHARQRAA